MKNAIRLLLIAGISGVLLSGCQMKRQWEYRAIRVNGALAGGRQPQLIVTKDLVLVHLDSLELTNFLSTNVMSGVLQLSRDLELGPDGNITISGGTLNAATNLAAGSVAGAVGSIVITDGGTLNVTNGTLGLGTSTNGPSVGSATITDGTVNASMVRLGSAAGGVGTLTLNGTGRLNVASNLTLVGGPLSDRRRRAATSSLTLLGGSLVATNGIVQVGAAGYAEMTISSGDHIVSQLKVGNGGAGFGSLYLRGGRLKILSQLNANFILVSGLDLDTSSGTIIIGDGHDAEFDVDSGSVVAGTVDVGYSPGFSGTNIVNGGMMMVTNTMIVGDSLGGALGTVTLNGGVLYVSNATQTAVLDIRNGTFTLNSNATLVVDQLIITNSCGHFQNLGGTLIMNRAPLLGANLDADNDGQSNANESLAGTDPLNPNSVLKLTSIVRTNNNQDIRVDWTTVGGHRYVVQTSGILGPNVFHDLFSVPISVSGPGESTTNYIHAGGARNATGFYRIRLAP